MFGDGACSVEGPNRVIPSFVRLERAKKRDDIRRQIFASAFNNHFKTSIRFGDGKVSRLGLDCTGKDGYRVPGLIQRGSKSLDRLSSAVGKLGGNWLCELDLVKLRQSIRIKIDSAFVGLLLEEFLDPRIKIANVLLRPKKSTLGALKWVTVPQRWLTIWRKRSAVLKLSHERSRETRFARRRLAPRANDHGASFADASRAAEGRA